MFLEKKNRVQILPARCGTIPNIETNLLSLLCNPKFPQAITPSQETTIKGKYSGSLCLAPILTPTVHKATQTKTLVKKFKVIIQCLNYSSKTNSTWYNN